MPAHHHQSRVNALGIPDDRALGPAGHDGGLSLHVVFAQQILEPLFRGGIEDMSVGFIVWHRSSVFGVFADTKGGVNFMGFGFEARF